MPDEIVEKPIDPVSELIKPLHFREEATIKGLIYIFEGDIPKTPDKFEWSVSIPNWEEQKPFADAMMTNGEINPTFDRWLEAHHLGNGRVGDLDIAKVTPKDQYPSIGVKMIRTMTAHLPRKFGYNQAEGVGSFLLDNLCALADINQWRIYLEPVDKGGKLMQGDLYRWYVKRGFDNEYVFPKDSHSNFGGMQRWPRTPDTSQAIANILHVQPVDRSVKDTPTVTYRPFVRRQHHNET